MGLPGRWRRVSSRAVMEVSQDWSGAVPVPGQGARRVGVGPQGPHGADLEQLAVQAVCALQALEAIQVFQDEFRAGPGLEGPHLPVQLEGRRPGIQARQGLAQLGGEGGQGVLLGGRRQRTQLQGGKVRQEQARGILRQEGEQALGGVLEGDGTLATGQHGALVQARGEAHEAHPGGRIPGQDGVVHGRGAAPAGQQGVVEVPDPQGTGVQHPPGQQVPVGGHHGQIDGQALPAFPGFRRFPALGLEEGEPPFQRRLLHGRRLQVPASALGAVRVAEDGRELPRLGQGLQGGHRGGGGAEKGDSRHGAA